ncbi:MAG: type II toxin-antitoxin system HicB family antitoxin [Candidatus Hydrogenedentes bacterium]|nr:type II toxin-antitoxin system HicB family antitoxin [Candidatus Hydrogenedentota bacterium]
MKSYTFPIEVEPDEDRWFARVPDLESQGAATWGYTRDEALRNMEEVAQMVIEAMLEDGLELPASVKISDQPLISVHV